MSIVTDPSDADGRRPAPVPARYEPGTVGRRR